MLRRTLFILCVRKSSARKEVARLARGRVGTGKGFPNLGDGWLKIITKCSIVQPVLLPGEDADLVPPGPDQAPHDQPECKDDLQGSLCAGIDGGEGDCCLLVYWQDTHVSHGGEKREEDEDEDSLCQHSSNFSKSSSTPPWFF